MVFTDARTEDQALALVRMGPRLREEASRVTPDVLDGYQLVHETLSEAFAEREPADEGRLSARLRERFDRRS